MTESHNDMTMPPNGYRHLVNFQLDNIEQICKVLIWENSNFSAKSFS